MILEKERNIFMAEWAPGSLDEVFINDGSGYKRGLNIDPVAYKQGLLYSLQRSFGAKVDLVVIDPSSTNHAEIVKVANEELGSPEINKLMKGVFDFKENVDQLGTTINKLESTEIFKY